MKKYILSLLICTSIVSSAFAHTLTPNGGTKLVGETVAISGVPGIDNFTNYYSWWTSTNQYVAGSETYFNFFANPVVPSTPGQYRLKIVGGSPSGGIYPIFPTLNSNLITVISPVYGCTNPLADNYNPSADTDNGSCIVLTGIEKMVRNSSSTFSATTGFSPGGAVANVGDMFIKPIIGGGLMMLQALLPWIIVLIVLSAFVYFAFRGFRSYMMGKSRNIQRRVNSAVTNHYAKTGETSYNPGFLDKAKIVTGIGKAE